MNFRVINDLLLRKTSSIHEWFDLINLAIKIQIIVERLIGLSLHQ